MRQSVLTTLKLNYFKWPTLIISGIFICVVAYFESISDIVIYPNLNNFTCDYYNDEANGGSSHILDFVVSDSLIKLSYQLNEGFQSPYVGLSLTPLHNKYINAQKYNQIKLCIAGKKIERIGFSLFTPPLSNIENCKDDETILHKYLNISETKTTYSISLNHLKLPDWWEDSHQISSLDIIKPEFDKILHINITSAFSSTISDIKSIELYSIVFTRDNKKLFFELGVFSLLLIGLYFAILMLIHKRKTSGDKITVSYKPIEMTHTVPANEKCLIYINSNYSDSALTLEKIAKECAITPRRITNIIHETFNCNFKTYLNQIRLTEAKRFLTQTDMNIGEIAFTVGFNSQSHFNRVFKAELNISPTEYRENNKP